MEHDTESQAEPLSQPSAHRAPIGSNRGWCRIIALRTARGCDLTEYLGHLRGDLRGTKVARREVSPLRPNARPEIRISQDLQDCRGERRRLAGRDQPSCLTIPHDFRRAPHARGNHGLAQCHGFQQDVAEGLPQ